MEQMRSEFEAWWENWCGEAPFLGWDKFRTPGGYNDPDIHMQWEAWKGGRAAIEIELPQRYGIDCFDVIEPDGVGFLFYRDEVIDAIRAAGLRVKEK